MKQNYKLYLAALLLVGATGMMTAGAQGSGNKPTLAVFVVGMPTDALGDALATQMGSNLTSGGQYALTSVNTTGKRDELRATYASGGGSSIDRSALAAWGRANGISAICLVVDDVKGSDHMFYAQFIDAKDSKLSGKGSYVRTSVGSGELPWVSSALAQQLNGSGRRRSTPAPVRSYPAELDIEMVQVEGAASVTLGYRATDGSSSGNNVKAAYTANVPSFKIGKYEVTQAQWNAVMAGTKFENYFRWGGKHGDPAGAIQDCGNVPCDDQRSVEFVTWYLALAFCNRLSDLVGKTPVYGGFTLADIADNGDCSACNVGANVTVSASANGYRLPTSNEWEYAARGCKAGVCEAFMYSGSNALGEVGWSATNPNAAFANGTTHPVGQLKPNGIGVYDMSGNVWERCYDIWDSGSSRVNRGGDWLNAASGGWERLAARSPYATTSRGPSIGFRVVLP
ncbi:MAG: formylglycine-generating enzyme family protein [Prevotellaceae bacterium]|jgi:formylglycine-generating enzyme required for sulfatase activity|nr:formylglycine-generating enzyme family protein [Prevotellaceae bacterium]